MENNPFRKRGEKSVRISVGDMGGTFLAMPLKVDGPLKNDCMSLRRLYSTLPKFL